MKLKPIPNDTVVHTPTKQEAKELLTILYENGWETAGSTDYVVENARGIQIESETDWSWWERIENARKEDYIILTLAEFKDKYVEKEKPQPKFKVGDLIKVVDYQKNCGDMMKKHVGEVGTVSKVVMEDWKFFYKINCDKGRFSWHEDWLKPYPEPETKEETMETKELNLCELLQGHEKGTFYSPCFGKLTLRETDCDSLVLITARGVIERFNLDGRLWTAVSTATPMLYPSRSLYEQYPLDPLKAWQKWIEEQTQYKVHLMLDAKPECAFSSEADSYEFAFRTPADRDKCIEEIKAIIEKYSEK